MVRLKITAKGQVTLRKEIRDYLGVDIGDEIDVSFEEQGQVSVRPARKRHTKQELFGMFAHKPDRAYSLEELDEAIKDGWAGKVTS
ncbi:AbrB/MazE/SpoVT family DNA-binding domain-containing protein [Rhizobium sp. C4]|uniref:AbrB/MazE/SpoVT family DNA-binding domain-containing protein n=1 Tax=Rhizobium sp. C4 TaxID=1349800 RepID=UPI001E4A0670|nr:AbrB/MazE/SpoVT family DNA-binding domain-containing protein [Rhizobium sp. C4]MCD2173718.1 AbrB/MazE/SpoVT family DNA-binding domain-containing protein [Rhizobium sp. C4]